jgi:hypothetical protein
VQTIFDRAGTNRVIMFRKHMMSTICAAALLCSSGGALAQTIYKQIDATGRTTFTDRPDAARIVVPYETSPSEERGSVSPPRIATGTRSDVEKALFRHTAMSSTYAATVDFNEAGRRLRQARQSLQEGMEPRPGERIDSAGTGAMDRGYQRRQQRLEREVVAAERRSRETSLVQSALVRRDGKADPVRLAQP